MIGITFAGLLVVSILSFQATKEMAEGYLRIRNADLSEGLSDSFFYDDKLYSMLGYGIQIDAQDPNKETGRDEFLESSLRKIDERILASDVLYGMLLETALAYPLSQRKKKILWVFLSVITIYLLLCGMNVLFSQINGIPFSFPTLNVFIGIAVSLFSVIAGTSILLWILEKIRFRKTAALLAIPLVYVLFLTSLLFEVKLYAPKYVESFDYLSEKIQNDENAYYDEEKNEIIVEGIAYPPQKDVNPVYLSGALRIPVYGLEVLDPYAGNSLEMLRQVLEEESLPPLLYVLYALKACGYVVLAKYLNSKKEKDEYGTVSTE